MDGGCCDRDGEVGACMGRKRVGDQNHRHGPGSVSLTLVTKVFLYRVGYESTV